MPRLPVDGKKVQEFRVTLGQFERDRIDTLITAITINKISTPLVALLSDVSAVSLLIGVYVSYRYGQPGLDLLRTAPESVADIVSDLKIIEGSSLLIKNSIPFGLGNLPNLLGDLLEAI